MISEEEKIKIEDAMQCSDCISWHKYCCAECCRILFLNINEKELENNGKYVTIRLDHMPLLEERWYYRLRGVHILRGNILRLPKENIRNINGKILYIRDCELLTKDCLCSGHPDRKPQFCKGLDVENHKINNSKIVVTGNCLFKYHDMLEKCKEVD